jgi:nucleoside 2-deoxyribosyltransferase
MFARSDPISETVMTATGYLAGPDVFLPNAVAHVATKIEFCRRSGLRGLPPLNEAAETAASNEQATATAGYEEHVGAQIGLVTSRACSLGAYCL